MPKWPADIIEHTLPLGERTALLILPADLQQHEADRISAFVQALAVDWKTEEPNAAASD